MDDNINNSLNPSDKNISSVHDELEHVTEEMYKKNKELADTNKTLALLRKIDAIILSSVTEIQQVAQQVANSIVDDTGFKAITILILDKKANNLERLAVSQTELINKAELDLNKPFPAIKIQMINTQNPVVKAASENLRYTTENLFDILAPDYSQEESKRVQEIIGIVSTIICPLIVRDQVIGAMIVNVGEKPESLSDHNKDLIDRLAGVIGIAIDNTILYQEIEDANKRLKELDQLKDEFVSLASHELRTPMTVIKSYLFMIMDPKNGPALTEKQKMYINRAYVSTERLINLVNDMLNVSRIESGRTTINANPIDISGLVNNVYIEMLPKAQELKVNLEFVKPQAALPKVNADSEKIEQVLINLIGNSLKFTPQNGNVKISIERNESEKTQIISILDNGRGISKVDIPKLFQKFSMVGNDNKTVQAVSGTGLGLYLSKLIVEMHGGKIWAESEGEGKGSKFSLTLKEI